jgi:uncharacterized damage-inducible protein DinB
VERNNYFSSVKIRKTMKELLEQYAAYNVWANQKLTDCIGNLTDDQINREITSSFSSIYKTLLHMWFAEDIWYQRLQLTEQPVSAVDQFTGNFSELVKRSHQQSVQLADWVQAATEAQLQHVFAYHNLKKEHFKNPVYQTLLHVFNHGAYHRGQLVTMLRQLNVSKIPPTDFTVFIRKK